jgi:hypothetical protein
MRVNEGRAGRNEEPIRFPPCMLERNIEIDYRLILKVLSGRLATSDRLLQKQ